MKKLLLPLLFIALFAINAQAQRILINENFETSGLNADSLPTGWVQYDEDGTGLAGVEWAVRDTGVVYPAGSNVLYKTQAHNSRRALTIGWRAGDPVANDWVFTDSLRILAGDSLRFYMILGSPILPAGDNINIDKYGAGELGGPPYIDSMEVYVSTLNAVIGGGFETRLGKIVALDSNNVWTEYKFDLSSFAGQRIYVAFRYWMNTTADGLLCYIDDVVVGNRASVGIQQIGNTVPDNYSLRQNYPNPFNPTTNIKFDLPKNGNVKLTVINSLGQVVQTLFEGVKTAGTYEASFDGKGLSSGTYFYRLEAGDYIETKKMLLVK